MYRHQKTAELLLLRAQIREAAVQRLNRDALDCRQSSARGQQSWGGVLYLPAQKLETNVDARLTPQSIQVCEAVPRRRWR